MIELLLYTFIIFTTNLLVYKIPVSQLIKDFAGIQHWLMLSYLELFYKHELVYLFQRS